jgi:predicted patatin/cPLA2 family phospholipase
MTHQRIYTLPLNHLPNAGNNRYTVISGISFFNHFIIKNALKRRAIMPAPHPVAQILYRRRNEGSVPGARTDGYRVGLVVEGGGMRGIISGAMMATLMDRELELSFDAIYASSSGAINSAYFLAGLGWYALSIYYDNLLDRTFLDIRRMLRGRPAMSLDYAFDVIMETVKPLNYAAVLASPIELHIATSSIRELKPRVFSHFASKEDLKAVLKASACLPLAAGTPIAYNGDCFLDGGVLLAHPILPALEDGCTHILVIRTRGTSPLQTTTWVGQRLMAGYLQHMRSGLGASYLKTIKQYRQLQQHFQEVSRHQDKPPFILEVACPAGAHNVTRFSQDRDTLLQGLRAGYRAMIEGLDGEDRPDHIYLQPRLFTQP